MTLNQIMKIYTFWYIMMDLVSNIIDILLHIFLLLLVIYLSLKKDEEEEVDQWFELYRMWSIRLPSIGPDDCKY